MYSGPLTNSATIAKNTGQTEQGGTATNKRTEYHGRPVARPEDALWIVPEKNQIFSKI